MLGLALLLSFSPLALAVPGAVIWGPGNAATVIPPVLNVGSINYSGGGSSAPSATTWSSPTSVTGLNSNSASGTTVTGVGTKYRTEFRVGDTITMNSETQTITSISTDTSLTTTTWTGANTSAVATRAAVANVFVYPNGSLQVGGTRTTPSANGVTINSTINDVSTAPTVGGNSNQVSVIQAISYTGAATNGSSFGLVKARGTESSPSVPVSGDTLGSLLYRGWKAADTLYSGAQIQSFATETWSSTAGGSKLLFWTTPNTTQTATLALTLDQDQSATFPGTVQAQSPTAGLNRFIVPGSNKSASIAQGANVAFVIGGTNGTGLVTIQHNTTGSSALVFYGYQNILVIVSQTNGSEFALTASPTATQTGIQLVSSTGTLSVYNGFPASTQYTVSVFGG